VKVMRHVGLIPTHPQLLAAAISSLLCVCDSGRARGQPPEMDRLGATRLILEDIRQCSRDAALAVAASALVLVICCCFTWDDEFFEVYA
jgi:hypothetical protein